MKDSMPVINSISRAIYDKKGVNILALDVREISSITDYFVIAEGNVDRHVKALAREVKKTMTDQGEKPLSIDGDASGEWVVLDYGNIIVHLFGPGMRDKYRLENIWKEGSLIDLDLPTPLEG